MEGQGTEAPAALTEKEAASRGGGDTIGRVAWLTPFGDGFHEVWEGQRAADVTD